MGIVFECWVYKNDDGTLEIAPFPESARFLPTDRDAEVEVSAETLGDAS